MTHEEFEQLYIDKYLDWLGFTESLLLEHRRELQAEDVLQEVWIAAFEELEYLNSTLNIHSYMLSKIRNYVRNEVWMTGYKNELHRPWQESKKALEWALPLTDDIGAHEDD